MEITTEIKDKFNIICKECGSTAELEFREGAIYYDGSGDIGSITVACTNTECGVKVES